MRAHMPNRFTRVPDGPVPALPRGTRWLLRPADLFMLAMLSRPVSGTLRTTWVTPATLALCVVTALAGLPLGAAALAGGVVSGRALRLVAGAVLVTVALGSVSVALVGALQRRERSPGG